MTERRKRKDSARRTGGVRLTMRKGETWYIGESRVEVVHVTPSKVELAITTPDGVTVRKLVRVDRSPECGENSG